MTKLLIDYIYMKPKADCNLSNNQFFHLYVSYKESKILKISDKYLKEF